MLIRKATPKDADAIADLMLLAMYDIVCEFIGSREKTVVKAFLQYFIAQKNNLYSYEHCMLVECKNKICASANVYNGGDFIALSTPVANYIKQNFNPDFIVEPETQAGEFYLDTLAVAPKYRRQGIGTHLLSFIINDSVVNQHKTLGLLVDVDNPEAEKLYRNLKFQYVGEKSLAGKTMKHYQRKPDCRIEYCKK